MISSSYYILGNIVVLVHADTAAGNATVSVVRRNRVNCKCTRRQIAQGKPSRHANRGKPFQPNRVFRQI